jgi:hypothetical protein
MRSSAATADTEHWRRRGSLVKTFPDEERALEDGPLEGTAFEPCVPQIGSTKIDLVEHDVAKDLLLQPR